MKKRVFLSLTHRGQGTVEYALIVIAVVAVLIAVLMANPNPFKGALSGAFTKMSAKITSASNYT